MSDHALIQQALPSGVEGVRSLEKFTRDGNAEVRKLLYEECKVLFECRYCRNVFRSPVLFTEHKRAFCNPSHIAVVPQLTATEDVPGTSGTSSRTRNAQASKGDPRQKSFVPLAHCDQIIELLRVVEEEGLDKIFEELPPELQVNVHIPPREVPPEDDDETSEEERMIRKDEEMRRARLRKKRISDLKKKDNESKEVEQKKEEKTIESNKTKNGISTKKNEPIIAKEETMRRSDRVKEEEKKGGKKVEKKNEKIEEKKVEKKEEKKEERKKEEKKEEKKKEEMKDEKTQGKRDRKKTEKKEDKNEEKEMDRFEAMMIPASPEKRQRKRPAWMNEEEMYDEQSKKKANETTVIEKEKSAKPDKKKSKAVVTPKEATPQKLIPQYVLPITPTKDDAGCSTPSDRNVVRQKEVMFYTPRAGQIQQEKMKELGESSRSSKRKQNLSLLADEAEEILIIDVSDPSTKKRSDIATMPVFLSSNQEKIFFGGMITHPRTETEGKHYECMYCHAKTKDINEGRRHMVSHVRVMRLRCGLCGVGAFFGVDMRNHLMHRGCAELSKAPAHMIKPGLPCMTKEDANELTFVAHPTNPGKVVMTSGKIVSITSITPYLPDLIIEEQMLRPTRIAPAHYSPRKPPARIIGFSAGKSSEMSITPMSAVQPSKSSDKISNTRGSVEDASSAESSKSSS